MKVASNLYSLFHFKIFPLVRPTKEILGMRVENYLLHEFLPNGNVSPLYFLWLFCSFYIFMYIY